MKKILFYSDASYFSGAEKSLALVSGEIMKDSTESMVIVTPNVLNRAESIVKNWGEQKSRWLPWANGFKLNFGLFLRLRKLIKSHKIELLVVNMWSPYANTLAILAGRGRPIISIFHYFQLTEDIKGPLSFLKRFAYRLVERKSQVVVTVSEGHKRVLIDQFHFPQGKVRVIKNGVDGPSEAIKREYGSRRRFLMVGSVEVNKGQKEVIQLLKDTPNGWSLTIVGGGVMLEELTFLVKNLGLAEKVTFTGPVTNLDKLYREHEVIINYSRRENLSMSLIEALSYSLPIIASNIPGNDEIVVEGENGYLVNLDDSAAWKSALSDMIEGSKLAKMSASAYQNYRQRFTKEKMINSYRNLFEETRDAQ